MALVTIRMHWCIAPVIVRGDQHGKRVTVSGGDVRDELAKFNTVTHPPPPDAAWLLRLVPVLDEGAIAEACSKVGYDAAEDIFTFYF